MAVAETCFLEQRQPHNSMMAAAGTAAAATATEGSELVMYGWFLDDCLMLFDEAVTLFDQRELVQIDLV